MFFSQQSLSESRIRGAEGDVKSAPKAKFMRESFGDNSNVITAVIQNNKYVAFKGIIDGVLSFPISGCINIESNIKSPVLRCVYARDIVDISRE